ncbi:MAG TPA: hypothetical protein VGL71_00820, partial [Urbifossiella sp.]
RSRRASAHFLIQIRKNQEGIIGLAAQQRHRALLFLGVLEIRITPLLFVGRRLYPASAISPNVHSGAF